MFSPTDDDLSGLPIDYAELQESVELIEEYDEYDRLPAGIQMVYTREQYLWLSDGEKQRLIETETEPEAV